MEERFDFKEAARTPMNQKNESQQLLQVQMTQMPHFD